MLSFKGILRYAVYLLVGGWMFFLGIMVGRGTSPVTFDTTQFHSRLETIAREFGKTKIPEGKMDLRFYDALNKPVSQEVKGKKNTPNEIIPKKETGSLIDRMPGPAGVPVKTSRKAATFNKSLVGSIPSRKDGSKHVDPRDTGGDIPAGAKGDIKNGQQSLAKDKTDLSGMYTIQIAAYKSFKDAVTQMARLEKKGFTSYRTLVKKEGVAWYRVRVGGFGTRAAASRYVEKLKQAKIDGMIIKKE